MGLNSFISGCLVRLSPFCCQVEEATRNFADIAIIQSLACDAPPNRLLHSYSPKSLLTAFHTRNHSKLKCYYPAHNHHAIVPLLSKPILYLYSLYSITMVLYHHSIMITRVILSTCQHLGLLRSKFGFLRLKFVKILVFWD